MVILFKYRFDLENSVFIQLLIFEKYDQSMKKLNFIRSDNF